MPKILILKGLPASGKSTYARELIRKNPGKWKRVNKDELRDMLDDGKWSKANEDFILATRDEIIIRALTKGYNVVVDDTNLSKTHEKRMKEIALLSPNIEVEIKFFFVSVEECIKRDLQRSKSVGEKVIRDMYNKYLRTKPPKAKLTVGLPSAIICDIDGTLAIMKNRGPYDWKKVGEDELNIQIAQLLILYNNAGYRIILVSGRDGSCKDETIKWLEDFNIPYHVLTMRAPGDTRKDSIVKKEIYDNHIKDKFNVFVVLDDRNQVVDMWRNELGLICFQVAEGDF